MKKDLKKANEYYENKKESWKNKQETSIKNYLTKKRIKREYGRNRCKNMSEKENQILKEYQKTIVKQKN